MIIEECDFEEKKKTLFLTNNTHELQNLRKRKSKLRTFDTSNWNIILSLHSVTQVQRRFRMKNSTSTSAPLRNGLTKSPFTPTLSRFAVFHNSASEGNGHVIEEVPGLAFSFLEGK